MKKFIAILALLFPAALLAQTNALQGYASRGGQFVNVSGLSSTNRFLNVIPSATITVYLTGTTTLATIYADGSGTPLANPFTADAITSLTPGHWLAYAADSQGYDVVGSGGIPPNTYAAPVPLCTDCFAGGGGGGGSFFAYVNGTALKQLGSVNFADSATATFSNPNTNVVQVTVVGGGGGCSTGGIPTTNGSVTGDNSSTNCGYENRVGDTAAVPAYVQTFGSHLLAANSATEMVAIGDTSAADSVSGSDGVVIGDHEAPYTAFNHTVSIGDLDLQGEGIGDPECNTHMVQAIGNNNFGVCSGADLTDVLMAGDSNLNFFTTPNHSAAYIDVVALGDTTLGLSGSRDTTGMQDVVAIGDYAGKEITHAQDVVAIGDFPLCCYSVIGADAVSDVVAIGDTPGSGMVNGESVDVAIGTSPLNESSVLAGHSPGTEQIAIGDAAGDNSLGTDIIAIGDTAVANSFTSGSTNVNTGHDIIGIGNHAAQANETGIDNIAIGDYAGCVGCTNSTPGNGNLTGSHNVWIGDTAGPNTATQLSNTIAIGYQAYNTVSNQVVLGNSSVTSLILYGCSAGQVAYDDGTGTCVSPVGSVSPLTTKGDIWVYSSTDTRLPVGTNGQILSANSAQTTGLQWINALSNPMTSVGDVITGGASGVASRVAANTTTNTYCLVETGTGSVGAIPTWGSCAGSAATAFSAITASTNTSAAMVVGAGASLDYASTGVIDTNKVFGATIPASATIVGTNSSHQIVDASSATLTNNTSGNAATATLATTATTAVNLASYPTLCSGGQFSQGLSSGSNNCANPAGGGTVTSVGLVLPSGVFAISGSPVTGSGNLIGSFQTQTANLVFAGPSSGSAAAPTFRALVSADLPPTSLASNLAGGALGSIPYQSATNGTSMLPGVTTAGQTFILSEQPGGSLIAPQWLNLGTYLASPPAIGGTAPAAAFFTTINGHNLPANTTTTVAGGTTVLATGKLLMPPITMSGVGSGCTVTFTPTTDMTTVGGWSPGQMLAPLPFGLTSNQINWYLINNTGSNITTAASVTFVVSAKC